MDENKIKITKDMELNINDLMSYVDTEHVFTLRDVLCACKNSAIPMQLLQELLQCPYIEDYYNEMDKCEKDDDKDINYLELSYSIEEDEEYGEFNQGWSFHGIGEEGVIPQDIIDHYSEEEVQNMRDDGFVQSYAVEYSPIYDLADYPIKIDNKVSVTNWTNNSKSSKYSIDKTFTLKGKPLIRLIEVLYEIFWELCFLGSPEERDKKKEDLGKRCEAFNEAKENGTLNCIDFQEVKEKFSKKYDLDI